MSSRPKVYKGNQQAACIIIKNKHIQALMTKQYIRSFSDSLLLLRNNNIVIQQQFMIVWMRIYYESTLDLFEYNIVSVIQ
jgi:hypothetical protein